MLSSFEFPNNPFKRIREEMDELQSEYARLEHVNYKLCMQVVECLPARTHHRGVGETGLASKGGDARGGEREVEGPGSSLGEQGSRQE